MTLHCGRSIATLAGDSSVRRQAVTLVIAVAIAMAQVPSFGAQVAPIGVISGALSGPEGALVGVTVQALDATGAVAATTITAQEGAFALTGLNPGTFVVQAVGTNGGVIGTSTAALTTASMTASVSISATAGALAAAATGVAAAGAAAAGGSAAAGIISANVVLISVGAAAAGLSTLAVVASGQDVSGSR